MRAVNRRVLNQPVKSPSPDISNRSIITQTKSPVNDVKQFIRMKQSCIQPKSMTSSFHQISKSYSNDNEQIQKLKKYIHQLEMKVSYFDRMKATQDQLYSSNQQLNAQIVGLKQELLKRQKNQTANSNIHNLSPKKYNQPSPHASNKQINQNVSTLSQKPVSPLIVDQSEQNQMQNQVQTDNILRQFNQRMMKMAEQNKRLGKKLKQIKQQKDLLQLQNDQLKEQNLRSPQFQISQPQRQSSRSRSRQLPQQADLQVIKEYFLSQAQRIYQQNRRLAQTKLRLLQIKLNKTQDKLNRLTAYTNRARSTDRSTSPLFQKKTNISTDVKTDYPDQYGSQIDGNRIQMVQSKYTTSPTDIKAFTLESSPVRTLEEEKYRLKNQNQRLNKKTKDLQNDLKKALIAHSELQKKIKQGSGVKQTLGTSSGPQFSMNKFYQQKILALQNQLNSKISSLKIKQLRIDQLQKRLQQDKSLSKKQIQTYILMISQQKSKQKHFEQQLGELKSHLCHLEQSNQQLNNQKYQTLQHFHQLQQDYQLLKQKYIQERDNLARFLELTFNIRYSITSNQVEQTLKQIDNKYQGVNRLERQIWIIKQTYDGLLNHCRSQLLQQQRQIAQTQRDNYILNQTVKQLNIERQKLQNAISQYQAPIRTKYSQQQLKQKISAFKSSSKSRQTCQMREYITRTVSKISTLQKELNSAIKVQNQYRQTSQFQANPDEMFKTTIKPKERSYQHQYVEDPSIVSNEESITDRYLG